MAQGSYIWQIIDMALTDWWADSVARISIGNEFQETLNARGKEEVSDSTLANMMERRKDWIGRIVRARRAVPRPFGEYYVSMVFERGERQTFGGMTIRWPQGEDLNMTLIIAFANMTMGKLLHAQSPCTIIAISPLSH